MEILFVILVIVVLIVLPNVKIVPQAKSYVIERLGSYYVTWRNGLHFKFPFIDEIHKVIPFQPIFKFILCLSPASLSLSLSLSL